MNNKFKRIKFFLNKIGIEKDNNDIRIKKDINEIGVNNHSPRFGIVSI